MKIHDFELWPFSSRAHALSLTYAFSTYETALSRVRTGGHPTTQNPPLAGTSGSVPRLPYVAFPLKLSAGAAREETWALVSASQAYGLLQRLVARELHCLTLSFQLKPENFCCLPDMC